MKQYCIDSSAFIQGKHIRYPMDNFPSVWEKFGELIKNEVFIIPRHVYDEIAHGDDDLAAWIKLYSKHVVQIDSDLVKETTRITKSYSIVDPNSAKEIADPWVIALSKLKSTPCVNEETLSGDNKKYMKIPNVCKKEHIISMTLVEAIKELGLKF